jgi:ABC-2 type transport system ATP-binding protein
VGNILEIHNVVKTYDKYRAVNQVSVDMPEGCSFGLLGPNGAGKSSLIRMITTITRPDSGTILFNGTPINSDTPNFIGYMPEERGLYKKMKVGEQILYLAQLKGLSRHDAERKIRFWFEKLAIQDWWNKKVEELSKGMQQKLQFVSTVVHDPKLLILDEPFSGLDPINAELLKNEIYELHQGGTSIIFSTHRMEQVEEICDQIVLINKGHNVLQGSVKNIKNQYKENLYRIDYEGVLPPDFAAKFEVVKNTPPQYVVIKLPNMAAERILLEYLLAQNNFRLTGFQEILPTLNEIFIRRVAESN